MPKWNIDKGLEKVTKALALESTDGCSIQRVLMDNTLLMENHLKRDEATQPDGRSTLVWSIGIGQIQMPKVGFFYGYTIYEAYQRARQGVKAHLKALKRLPKKPLRKAMPRSKTTNGKHVGEA